MTTNHHHDHRLDALESRLRSARSRQNPRDHRRSQAPVWGPGARVAVDFVAALAVGVALGLMIDYWLDSKPWGLIVFFVLGAAAGMMNVYRIAHGHDMAVGYRQQMQGGGEPENPENTEKNQTTLIKNRIDGQKPD